MTAKVKEAKSTLDVIVKDDGVVFISHKDTNQWVELTREEAISLAKTIVTKLME